MSTRLRRWQSLLEQTEVKLNTPGFHLNALTTVSAADLEAFEVQLKVTLPLEYKEFCQVFGEGCFGQNFVCIDCATIKGFKSQTTSNAEIIEACKSSFRESLIIQELLDNAYLFGLGDQGTLLVFDLRTYDQADQSYNIYAIDDNGQPHQIGRDFYNFIANFCLGTELETKFPQLARTMGYERQEPRNQFTALKTRFVLD